MFQILLEKNRENLNIYIFILFYFIFKLYNIVLVLPNIKMNPHFVLYDKLHFK